MSAQIKDGGAAFPCEQHEMQDGTWNQTFDSGMTLRQYAAIKLRVPESGDDWLDDMIRNSLRDEFAAKAMQAYAESLSNYGATISDKADEIAEVAYEFADSMLIAR